MTPRDRAIACIAYDLWEISGRRSGREMENWLSAELIFDHLIATFDLRVCIHPFTVN